MNHLTVTDRTGYVLHEESAEHSLKPVEEKLLVKYGKDKVFVFRAEPSRDHSLGPSRMVTARRFAGSAE
jgi:hypothetical protein